MIDHSRVKKKQLSKLFCIIKIKYLRRRLAYFKQHEAAVIAGSEMICGQCDICHRSINMSRRQSLQHCLLMRLFAAIESSHTFCICVIYRFLSNFERCGFTYKPPSNTQTRGAHLGLAHKREDSDVLIQGKSVPLSSRCLHRQKVENVYKGC